MTPTHLEGSAEARQHTAADTVHAAVGPEVFQAAAAGVVHLPGGRRGAQPRRAAWKHESGMVGG